MSIDWQNDPELADLVRRARNGERIVDDSDVEADRREARKARNREASRLCNARRRARLKAMKNERIGEKPGIPSNTGLPRVVAGSMIDEGAGNVSHRMSDL